MINLDAARTISTPNGTWPTLKCCKNIMIIEQALKRMTGHADQIEIVLGPEILQRRTMPVDIVPAFPSHGDIKHRLRRIDADDIMTFPAESHRKHPGPASGIEDAFRCSAWQRKIEVSTVAPAV